MEKVDDPKPAKFHSLSSKFSIFIGVLLMWVVAVIVLWDIRAHKFDLLKGVVLCVVALLVAGAISRFTIRLLARPLILLHQGITSVRQGKFEPIQVSRTGDEIEYLGESFNRMIENLAQSHEEIRRHGELLEERIRQRTEDLEKAMRAALAASQTKSEFLANMSHELRTPMNGLLGMMDLVLDSRLQPEQREHLEIAQRCAYSLLALLNDILDLSKIEAGKMMLEHIPFNVRTVLDDCVKSYNATASQKKITLHFEMDVSAPRQILGDPLRLRQVVANLLSNAVKFTDRGWVSLRLSAEAIAGKDPATHRNMLIAVSDSGPGIAADKLPFIFDKFTQADGSITRKYGGTGLGLAITRRLADIQSGQVQVESTVGKGSTFTVTIPCQLVDAPQPEPAESSGQGQAKPAVTAAIRVLLVEDNLVNQRVVMAILKKHGYHIDVANNGWEALTKLETSAADEYQLVLMDIQMPVLDGLETTRTIRRDPRWLNLPIIAMTAHAMNGDRERCIQAGMNAYISKPVQPAHLVSMIEGHLHNEPVETPVHTSAIERALTDRLMQGDSAMVNDLLHVFLQLAPERLDRLEAAADQADGDLIAAEAKNIGAAAEQLTSRGLGECARRIEQAAARADFDTVKHDLQTLKREIQSLESLMA